MTSYGRYLLSLGKFDPVYYAFHDDDILYDALWGSYAEHPNSTHDRIKESPRLRVQSGISSAEDSIKKLNRLVRTKLVHNEKKDDSDHSFQDTPNKHYNMPFALGTSGDLYDEYPAWNVKFLKGQLSGAVSYLTGSHLNMAIPQLTASAVTYNSRVVENISTDEAFNCDNINPAMGIRFEDSSVFEDGTSIVVEGDSLLLEINEENTEFKNENFEIEVYREEILSDNTKILSPLYFEKQNPEIQNNLLVDREDLGQSLPVLDSTYVSHYFEILSDSEIPNSVLAEVLPEGQTFGILSRRFLKKSDPSIGKTLGDIYADDYNDEAEVCGEDVGSSTVSGQSGKGNGGGTKY